MTGSVGYHNLQTEREWRLAREFTLTDLIIYLSGSRVLVDGATMAQGSMLRVLQHSVGLTSEMTPVLRDLILTG